MHHDHQLRLMRSEFQACSALLVAQDKIPVKEKELGLAFVLNQLSVRGP